MNEKELALKIRQHIVEMTHRGNSSHIGSALSIADIVAVLYGKILKYDSLNPTCPHRDRFILSKGHAGTAIYAALAESGFFDKEIIKTYYQDGSILSGHISHKSVAGVEFSTGSLGHGLAVGAGMAYHAKLKSRHHRIFVLLSDGDCEEGSTWESILFAAHHKLSNLIAIVDHNKIQALGNVAEVLDLYPFAEKWAAFNWNVKEIDGHSFDELLQQLSENFINSNKPTCIIAHTIKGKGISFMENQLLWHYRSPQGDDYIKAMQELEISK